MKKEENQKPSDVLTNELAHAGQQPGMSPGLLELEKHRITSDKVLPPMEFLFSLFDEPCFPRRELVAFTGRAKSGKTFVMSILMVLCMIAEVLAFRRQTKEKLRVMWYDTEQSDNSTQDILKNRIMPLFWRAAGEGTEFPEEMFDIFNVRNLDRDKREAYLLEAIEYHKPDLVILDGIRDLVGDINDGTVAQELIEKLMKIAQINDCCIVCVLHQNKSGESRDPRGWLGTELLNKAFDVFATEKLMPQRIFKLEQLYTRKYDIEQCLYFSVDEDGLPIITDEPPIAYVSQQDDNGEGRSRLNDDYVIHHIDNSWEINVEKLFTDVFKGYDTLTGAALRYAVMSLGKIETRGMYNNCLNKAMNMGLMTKKNDSKNRRIYSLNTPQPKKPEPQQQELWKNGDPF